MWQDAVIKSRTILLNACPSVLVDLQEVVRIAFETGGSYLHEGCSVLGRKHDLDWQPQILSGTIVQRVQVGKREEGRSWRPRINCDLTWGAYDHYVCPLHPTPQSLTTRCIL